VIACAERWEDIELYGRSKRAWLETFLALPNSIPSHELPGGGGVLLIRSLVQILSKRLVSGV